MSEVNDENVPALAWFFRKEENDNANITVAQAKLLVSKITDQAAEIEQLRKDLAYRTAEDVK